MKANAHMANRHQAHLRVVGLVCSAGGLKALIEILRNLPTEFPAAILVVQHIAA